MEAEITGTIELSYDREPDTKKLCICCPGFPSHVYGQDFVLGFNSSRFNDVPATLTDWLRDIFPFKDLDGRKIRITAELIDDEPTNA